MNFEFSTFAICELRLRRCVTLDLDVRFSALVSIRFDFRKKIYIFVSGIVVPGSCSTTEHSRRTRGRITLLIYET